MKKRIEVTKTGTLTFFYVKNSPFYKDRMTYGVFITKFKTIDFTSTSFILNFARSIIRIEWKHIIK